jgi:hypothetical protein
MAMLFLSLLQIRTKCFVMLPYAHVANLLSLSLSPSLTCAFVRDTGLLTFLMEFKMFIPDGVTLQRFHAAVFKSPQLGSSTSVKLAKKNKEMRFWGLI